MDTHQKDFLIFGGLISAMLLNMAIIMGTYSYIEYDHKLKMAQIECIAKDKETVK